LDTYIDPAVDYYKHNDSAKAIGQIRHRLATMGDLKRILEVTFMMKN
jgi:hypothetical protein